MILSEYSALLAAKAPAERLSGLKNVHALNPALFDYQRDVADFLLRIGSGAALLDTGLGKTLVGLEWAQRIVEHTNRSVLMLAPLAVGQQHEREAQHFGIDARYIREPSQITSRGIWITNYERLHLFSPGRFVAIVLDESSLLKSFGGKASKSLIEFGALTRYRLAMTATPAPNDHMEIGQHSAFLQIMPSREMLARWFIADQSSMGRYRLKHYGIDEFWAWVASWSRMATRPSDLGYSDEGFTLPKLRHNMHYIEADLTEGADPGSLFRVVDTSATSIHKEKRRTAPARAERIAEIVAAEPDETWAIWCDTDYEADALARCLPDAVEVRGSMRPEVKEERLVGFSNGAIRVLITKPSVAGFGLNWQHCARCAFVGLSFSYESYYQAVRRFWRFGQKRTVEVHTTLAETESTIWQAIQRKARDHESMKQTMSRAMRHATIERDIRIPYRPAQPAQIPGWLS